MKTIQLAGARLCLVLVPFFFLVAGFNPALQAQTDVRAWYADGQVWVIWQVSLPLPETYAIYAKPTAFTNTADAVLVGRLFKEEFGPGALREQIDSLATYRIPDGQGGLYQLEADEGLFVATPHQGGALWLAVVPWGQSNVTAGVNLTVGPVTFQYDPLGDPVECHLQKAFPSPFAAGFNCLSYYLWADGRQNQWENRPDFPVMANAAKNGMPSLFLISVPADLDTTQPFPLTVWLHGGDGTARQSLAGARAIVNIKPQQGILLAHNDDLIGYLLNALATFNSGTRHFGWRKSYDPFTPNDLPSSADTVVNYTQRRYRWIDDWLARHFNVDTARISINGHSMGSKGATAMAKVFPDHYASATVFNNGFIDDPMPSPNDVIYGPVAYQLFTNLRNESGQPVRFHACFNLSERVASQRDLPLFRSFHGKNDDNSENHWGPNTVGEYRAADSLGMGMQLLWSERDHGIETGIDYNDHWAYGFLPTEQTAVDNVNYEENFRSDVSFPAFFNHRLDPQNNDPGTGLIGIDNGDGDNWGSWGGWHRWDWNDMYDDSTGWAVLAWLESGAIFANDNCPVNSLTADLAIRKPQHFQPPPGTPLSWLVFDSGGGQALQFGNTVVQSDSVVVIPQVTVYRENIRRVWISIADLSIGTNVAPDNLSTIRIFPNPTSGRLYLPENAGLVRVFDAQGKPVLEKTIASGGELDVTVLPGGFYFLKTEKGWGKFVRE